MNRSCLTLFFTGLFIISIDSKAIAKESTLGLARVCSRLNNQASLSTEASTKAIGSYIASNSISSNPKLNANAKSKSDTAQTSFWWAAKQFDPFNGKLVQNWLAYPQFKQINLVVNWQLWALLDYFGRYRFVNQFGTVARKYGYSLNISDREDRCLAIYEYNPTSNPPKWELKLQKLGRDSLPIES